MVKQNPSLNTLEVNLAEVFENLTDKVGISNLHMILMEKVSLLDTLAEVSEMLVQVDDSTTENAEKLLTFK